MAAIKTGRFSSIVPEMAAHDLPPDSVHLNTDEALRSLAREAMLAWNPQ